MPAHTHGSRTDVCGLLKKIRDFTILSFIECKTPNHSSMAHEWGGGVHHLTLVANLVSCQHLKCTHMLRIKQLLITCNSNFYEFFSKLTIFGVWLCSVWQSLLDILNNLNLRGRVFKNKWRAVEKGGVLQSSSTTHCRLLTVIRASSTSSLLAPHWSTWLSTEL